MWVHNINLEVNRCKTQGSIPIVCEHKPHTHILQSVYLREYIVLLYINCNTSYHVRVCQELVGVQEKVP